MAATETQRRQWGTPPKNLAGDRRLLTRYPIRNSPPTSPISKLLNAPEYCSPYATGEQEETSDEVAASISILFLIVMSCRGKK